MRFRKCNLCHEIKTDEDFNFRNIKLETRVTYCKLCVRKLSNDWYLKNKERHKNTNKQSRSGWGKAKREENKNLLIKLKNVPCFDCKKEYSHWSMQFDQ